MELFERVGLSRDRVDPTSDIASVERTLKSDERVDNADYRRYSPITTGHLIAIEYYLLEDRKNARFWAKKVLDFADEYFFGEWRDRIPTGNDRNGAPDRAWWDRRARFRTGIEACLLWSSCLGEWERLKRFASYLRDDVRLDIEQPEANRAWLLLVAGVLRARSASELTPFRQVIEEGNRKREQLLLQLLDAISGQNETDLAAATTLYFKYYKQAEAKGGKTTDKVASDGSFLVHYSRHLGRELSVPANAVDHVIVL